jgi:hypothetical protein
MTRDSLYYAAAGILCAAFLLTPARTQTRIRTHSHDFNINVQGDAEHCADLKVSSSGELAQVNDSFTLQKSEAPVLEIGALDHGVIHVVGWNQPQYTVETCKIAVAGDRASADQLVRGISVTRSAGRFSTSGPASDSGDWQWQVYFMVHAPQSAALDLETKNGPISVKGVSGTVKVRATNGPISLSDVSGAVDAHTTNGPISFSGSGGDVRLSAQNGPISVSLPNDVWNGALLEARTVNGPLSVHLPSTFRSGVRLETSRNSPLDCQIDACRNAFSDLTSDQRTLQLNGASDTIRLSTHNGPLSVSTGVRHKII